MSKLNERALRPLVLQDLVHNIISVDEYQPKIDENNIVVLFKVKDNFDAAYDLSSFIERAPVGAVDTEAVETPNVEGTYNVFIEFKRDGEFIHKFMSLIKNLKNVCGDVNWKIQVYNVNDPIDLADLAEEINLTTEDELKEFFDYSSLNVSVMNECIKLVTYNGTELIYKKGSGLVNESYVKKLLDEGHSLDNTRLSSVLGNNYTVLKNEDQYIVGIGDKFLILR